MMNSGYRFLLITLTLTGLLGCNPSEEDLISSNFDDFTTELTALRSELINDNLEPRLRHGLLPSGFYQPELARDWTPAPLEQQKGTLITQNRFIYIMAMGYEVTSDPRYLAAMKLATDYLLTFFANPNLPGHWYGELNPDGTVRHTGFHDYGHTQVLFALSHAFKVTGDVRYKDAAFKTWLALSVPTAIAGKHEYYKLERLNVAMHLFESILVFYKATRLPMVYDDLEALGEYIVSHFYNAEAGFFGEYLTPELNLVPDGDIRLGHAIEISFLLSRAVAEGLPARYLEPANNSVSFVAAIAAKDPRGLIPHTTNYTGYVRDATYYWWSQTELLRGLAHFSIEHNRTDLEAQYELSRDSVKKYYIDTEYRGWFSDPEAEDKSKGQQWKIGYHVTMMQTELMRLLGAEFRSGSEVLL